MTPQGLILHEKREQRKQGRLLRDHHLQTLSFQKRRCFRKGKGKTLAITFIRRETKWSLLFKVPTLNKTTKGFVYQVMSKLLPLEWYSSYYSQNINSHNVEKQPGAAAQWWYSIKLPVWEGPFPLQRVQGLRHTSLSFVRTRSAHVPSSHLQRVQFSKLPSHSPFPSSPSGSSPETSSTLEQS